MMILSSLNFESIIIKRSAMSTQEEKKITWIDINITY